MAMGQVPGELQAEFWLATQDLPRSPGHPFYARLNQILDQSGFDSFCESECRKFYAPVLGRPSVAPGRYFRMLLIGYFEKLDSERDIEWKCADSLSLRSFLRLAPGENVPDHCSLSRTRRRLDLDTHRMVFEWVLKRLADHELLSGKTTGVDSSTIEANAAMRSIVRKDNGESYQEFLTGLAQASGIETSMAADLAKFDRSRKNKKVSNEEWHNPHDPDAKIAKMKDGTTHLAYKPEHVVDLVSGAIVAAEIHPADQGDTATLLGTLAQAAENLSEVSDDGTVEGDTSKLGIKEVVVDKGYHSGATLVDLETVEVRGYVSEPDRGRRNWISKNPPEQLAKRAEQEAVYRNRRRAKGERSKRLHRQRGELVERAFEHVLDDGGMRRVHLKGRENVHKRYLIHVAGFNLGLILRKMTGFGTPKGWADALRRLLEAWIGSFGASVRSFRRVLIATKFTPWSTPFTRAPRCAA